MRVFISACGCHPRVDCRVDDWTSALAGAGHEVIEHRSFIGYAEAFDAIDDADAVLGLVNRANGTQWAIELCAPVDGESKFSDEIFYKGAKKPTLLHWPDEGCDPYPFFDELVEHGAIRLSMDFDSAVREVLTHLQK